MAGMKKRIMRWIAVVIGMALLLCYGARWIGSRQQKESLKQLERAIRKGVLLCYGTEGVYPCNIQYLKDYYGLQIDEGQYTVFYVVFGDNLMPDITVVENQQQASVN
jgi:hypothetical protein